MQRIVYSSNRFNLINCRKLEQIFALLFVAGILLMLSTEIVKIGIILSSLACILIIFPFVLLCVTLVVHLILIFIDKSGFEIIFFDRTISLKGYNEENVYLNKTVSFSEFSKVYLDINKYLRLLTGSEKSVIAILAGSCSKEKIEAILKEFQKRGKDVNIASELNGLYSLEGENSSSINKITDRITIESKYIFPKERNIFYIVGGLYLLSLPPILISKLAENFISPGDIIGWTVALLELCYLLSCLTQKIIINPDNFIYESNSIMKGKVIISWKQVSKVEFTADSYLVFYNNDIEQDSSFSVKYFKHDDIQILLNMLNQKVRVTIDPEIQEKEKFLLKSNDSKITRRRTVHGDNLIKVDNKNIYNSQNQHQEHDKKSQNNTKRRLEL